MKNSKKTVRGILVGAFALAMGITVLFAGAGKSYAAGEAGLNKKSFNVLTRRTFDLDVANAPKDAVITWKSSNPAVAVVDEDGVVTGITKGEAKITCEVTVEGKTQKLIATAKVRKPAVRIEINNKIEELKYGKEYDLNRTLTPSKSNDVTTWTSSDESVATVDKNGVVYGEGNGTVIITATTMSGKTDSVEITVYGAPEPTPAPGTTPAPGEDPKPTKAPKPTQAPKPSSNSVYTENFEKGQGKFSGHGGASVSIKKSASAADGTQFLQVSGRSATWQGTGVDVNGILKLGGTYKLTAYVKQNSADSENIKATLRKNGGEYSNVSTVAAAKNEWTEISGEFTVADDTTDLLLYFESDTTMDFMVDKFSITEVKAGTKLIVEPVDLSKAVVLKAVELQRGGYDYTFEEAGGNAKLAWAKQYAEAQFKLPQKMKIGDFKEIILTMSSTDLVGVKLLNSADMSSAITFWWSKGSADMADITLSYSKTGYGENEQVADELLNKEFDYIGIMAQNAACEAVLKSITLVPR